MLAWFDMKAAVLGTLLMGTLIASINSGLISYFLISRSVVAAASSP